MIIWKVSSGKQSVYWEYFSEAWSDFKSLDYKRRIRPFYISRKDFGPFFKSLKEHTGW